MQHARIIFALVSLLATTSQAADDFQQKIQPFMQQYCIGCHNQKEARGELNLTRYTNARDVTASFRRWNHIIEFIRDGEMPPEDAKRQPSIPERKLVVEAIETILLTEAKKHAGDPGVILPRRLSNTEYDLSIRDLTGVDIRPTKEFPADPAGGEGFDNTGEALTMSPSLLRKYLAAAQHVSEHLVLKTDGVTFAPFPVTSYNERKKLTEGAIIDFYQRHEVKIADYIEAAWRYRFHKGRITIEDFAQQQNLSGKYLATVLQTLNDASGMSGYLQQLGNQWNALPRPKSETDKPQELVELVRFIDFCRKKLGHPEERLIRPGAGNWPIGHLDFRTKQAAVRDKFNSQGFKTQHLVRFDRLRAPKERDKKREVTLYLRLDSALPNGPENYVVLNRPIFSKSGNLPRNDKDAQKQQVVTLQSVLPQLPFGKHPKGHKLDADSLAFKTPALLEITLNEDQLKQVDNKHLLLQCELAPQGNKDGGVLLQHAVNNPPQDHYGSNIELLMRADSPTAKSLASSAKRFCKTFPNRFFYVDSKRGLAAGFHLVEGFFRDDQPLVEKVLNDDEQAELNQLWEELDFVTQSAETLIRGFVWFERSERHVLHDKRFDFLRPEDPKLVENELLDRFEKVYLEKMGIKRIGDTLKPEKPSEKYEIIHGFFEQIRTGLAHRRELLKRAEEKALNDLDKLARRAYRRSLRPNETESLRQLYHRLRAQGQSVEESLRGVFVAILMSPDFCYRYNETPSAKKVSPLSNDALASRLSYFVWSSLPDEELLRVASEDKLQNEKELLAQTRRMLKDERVDAFAREFFGQWLRYRDYLTKDSVNAEAFPGYTDELRAAMFEEPIWLATHLIHEDKPITNLLNSDTTFVNELLARHYGGDIAKQYATATRTISEKNTWQQVTGLHKAGRGGLFGMGVILTKNSSGERTSPVKRGFWTVHHLLGQHFPPPPADVPELPPNEKEAKKTIRELIAEHTVNPKCAMCHTHFDSLGMALEGFDPIGRTRTKDLAGRKIDNVAKLPSGKTAQGIPGLIEYVEQHRRDDFVRTMCRKFLGYALGRSVVLSDQPLLNEMQATLKKNDYRFSVLFESVVKSPQFRNQRGG